VVLQLLSLGTHSTGFTPGITANRRRQGEAVKPQSKDTSGSSKTNIQREKRKIRALHKNSICSSMKRELSTTGKIVFFHLPLPPLVAHQVSSATDILHVH
jgi:hypothetical protein